MNYHSSSFLFNEEMSDNPYWKISEFHGTFIYIANKLHSFPWYCVLTMKVSVKNIKLSRFLSKLWSFPLNMQFQILRDCPQPLVFEIH